jgi:hypothetical protein
LNHGAIDFFALAASPATAQWPRSEKMTEEVFPQEAKTQFSFPATQTRILPEIYGTVERVLSISPPLCVDNFLRTAN